MSELSPDIVRKPPPFSGAVRSGSSVYVSGQGGIDRQSKQIVGPDLESQLEATMRNIEHELQKAGLELSHVVRATVYLSDRSLYNRFNELYVRYFDKPYPSRTVVYCDLNYDLLVEIDVIATTDADREFY